MGKICPWCDTKIVWDEALRSEEECPHCHNEWNAYRTLNVEMEHDDDKRHENHKGNDHHNHEEVEEKGWSNFDWAEDPTLFGDSDSLFYQEVINKLLHEQVEVPECPQCRQYMVLAGTETIGSNHFESSLSDTLKKPIVTVPFRMDVYVCLLCFQVTKLLAEQHRKSMMEVVRRVQSK